MPQFSIGVRTGILVTATPLLEIIAPASARPSLLELEIGSNRLYANGNTESAVLGIGRPAAAGIGALPFIGSSLVSDDFNKTPSNVVVAQQWAKPPTVPTTFLRRFQWFGGDQAGFPLGRMPVRLKFGPRGLTVSPSTTLVVWVIAYAVATNGPNMISDINLVFNI